MSFILDALKKSESDRQRQSGPSLFEVKVAPPRRTLPVWAVAIAVLLGINVVVVSWMLLRRAPAQEPAARDTPAAAPASRTLGAPASGGTAPAPAAPPAASGASTAGRAAAGVSAPAASPPSAPGSLGQASVAAASTGPQPALQGAVQPPDTAASDSAPAVQPSAGRGAAASAATGVALPLYQQVVASDGLPALHLDLHVYARNPKDRFVMINMHKLVEGNSLPDGVHVDTIRPDGVVLSYHGTRFLLPRD